jgi:hypothetical protein
MKMAFQPINPQFWKQEKEGDEITGTLVRVEDSKGKYKSKIYHIITEQGAPFSFFGSTVLNDKMAYVVPGDKIKVVFKGKKKSEDEKSEYNDYEVFKDDGKTPSE